MSAVRLADLIRELQPCVALTGAGASTESGIPDFRSAEGIWARYDPGEVASIEGFRRDPERVWEFYARRLGLLADAAPSGVHLALARLEQLGLLRGVVTQNVDGLHQQGGSGEVVEVHGSIRSAVCPACGARASAALLRELLPVPRCACGAFLKPGVVMFGELLPVEAFERAAALCREARLLLVVGSSLAVHPVASLPFVTLEAGGALVIVNREPTPLDSRAALLLGGSAGEVLSETVALLEGGQARERAAPPAPPGA